MAQKKSFLKGKERVTFLDLFAGAGGISEGFLQALANNKYFDFILASDINENCELTHRVRYNEQLGLKTKFITEDIMNDSFVDDLLRELKGERIDVVTGGPSCQSFSLSGRRKRFDKRDNLFMHYLKVIRKLRPKYFVMENVKGILTKDHGKFKDAVLSEIRSIIDDQEVDILYAYLQRILPKCLNSFERSCIMCKIKMEIADGIADRYNTKLEKEAFFKSINENFRNLTSKINYQISKSDANINTIRHGINLLLHDDVRESIQKKIVELKTTANIDNDVFAGLMNEFLAGMQDDEIVKMMDEAFDSIPSFSKYQDSVDSLKSMIHLYSMSLDEVFDKLKAYAKQTATEPELGEILNKIRLYQIDKPIVVLSANYGVPQNRERVLFIGCRKDQKLIKEIPATVKPEDRVTVYEAINDLDFIGNGETATEYPKTKSQQNPLFDQIEKARQIDGEIDEKSGKSYAEWSREGRLSHRFAFECKPFYVKEPSDLYMPGARIEYSLFNHQTSDQSEDVRKRLSIIVKHGGYDEDCKAELASEKLETNKRNYAVLDPEGQSPTVVTMPDDFIHYSACRAMTVREMARLQSFDDSFVFQGKRQTGGDKRKSEIPQYTLVGNAVPPLMSRAIANVILSVIE